MKKRMISMLLALAVCLMILPAMALAEGTDTAAAITICGETWSTSTYAKIEAGEVRTENADETDYNIYWDANAAVLTLNGAVLSVKDAAVISAEIEKLTIQLAGENVITAEHTKGSGRDENLSVISNSGEIEIRAEEEDASLTVKALQTGNLNSSIAGIYTGAGLTNSAKLSIEVTVDAAAACSGEVSGIEGGSGAYEGSVYQMQSAFLQNSGDITIKVENQSLNAWYGTRVYAGLLYGGAMTNSGTLEIDVSTINGSAYGLRGTNTTEPWINEGSIVSSVTAYGGNYEGVPESLYKSSNFACAVSIVASIEGACAQFDNKGTMELTAVNYGKNKSFEFAIGLELDAGGSEQTETVLLDNGGTISVEALEGCTYGILLMSYHSDARAVNAGDIDIVATTDGHEQGWGEDAYAIGLCFEQSTSSDSTQYKTELILESGSSLSAFAHAAEGVEDADEITAQHCQAIQLQKIYYYDPQYTEAPQEIAIADDLVILEGGEPFAVFLEDYLADNMWVYISSIGAGSEGAETVIIVPGLTGEAAITGTMQVGQTLTAETSGIPEGVEVTYQWQSCDTADGEFIDIDGAAEVTYTLTSAEAGKYIRVIVTPVAGSGYAGTLTATSSEPVSTPYVPPVASGAPTYPPVVEGTENGSVDVSPANPAEGGKVTIRPIPERGYKVDDVIVTDKNGNPIQVTDNGDGTYSFIQPAGRVTISVVYVCDGLTELCPSHSYADVDTAQWYHLAVDFVVENGFMNGHANGSFQPYATLTRAMLAQILYNLDGQPAISGSSGFTDVADSAWYAEAVTWAAGKGIVTGYTNGTYGPEDPITREQLAVILWRYAGNSKADGTLPFADADQVSGYAMEAMLWATQNGVINGSSGKLNPKGHATRAEVAQMLMNFIQMDKA